MTTELLPVILTMVGIGIGLAGLMLVIMRMMNQRISDSDARTARLITESEARTTRLITESEVRTGRLITESEVRLTQRIEKVEDRLRDLELEVAEVKGTLNIIRDALPVRIGE